MFPRIQYLIIFLSVLLYPAMTTAQSLFGNGGYGYSANGAVIGSGLLGGFLGAIIAGVIVAWRKLTPRAVAVILVVAFGLLLIVGESSGDPFIVTSSAAISGFVGFGAGLSVVFAIFAESSNGANTRLPNVFGTARWASLMDLKKWGLIHDLKKPQGLLVGGTPTVGEEIIYDGQMHALTIAPTRAGKGASFIIPNLLRLDASILVVDPKGENARRTAARRVQMGQKVYIVDPWGISKDPDQYGDGADPKLSAKYNPLDSLKADDPDLATDAMMLADALVIDRGGDGQHWTDEAKGLIYGFILYLVTDKAETATLGRLRDLITLPFDPVKGQETMTSILTTMARSKHPLVRSSSARLLQKADKERSGVISNAQSNTHFLDSPNLRANLEKSDFSFEDLKTADTPVTVYLVLPLDRLPSFNRWLRLMVVTALKDLMRTPHPQGKPQVRIMLDEFAALERLDMVEKSFGTMAGLGVQLSVITQDLAQMERIYDKGWQTFVSNAGVFQYYGSRDKLTAEYVSSLCGRTTIKKISRSWSVGDSRSSSNSTSMQGGSFSSTTGSNTSESTTADDVDRPLIYPDELMTLPSWAQIVFVENNYPISCRKVNWFEDETLKALQAGKPVPQRQGANKAKTAQELAADKKAAEETKSQAIEKEKAEAEHRAKQREEVIDGAKKVAGTVGKGAKFMAEKLTEGQQKWSADIKDQENKKDGER